MARPFGEWAPSRQGATYATAGPHCAYPGFGGQSSAIAGFNHLTGWPDREALGPWATITDSLSPRYAAALFAAALLARDATGRAGNRDERAAPHGMYPCDGDDAWIAIAVRDDLAWDALCAAMGDPSWSIEARFGTPPRRLALAGELDARIAAWTHAFAPYDLMAGLQEASVAAGVVQTPETLLRDPQPAHRGHFALVEHTDEGRRDELGLGADEIAVLRERGLLA